MGLVFSMLLCGGLLVILTFHIISTAGGMRYTRIYGLYQAGSGNVEGIPSQQVPNSSYVVFHGGLF